MGRRASERPFFHDLVRDTTSGPVGSVQVSQGENAVAKNLARGHGRDRPKKAAPGTIRADFAESIERAPVHGSDSVENAKTEIDHFFKAVDICPRS